VRDTSQPRSVRVGLVALHEGAVAAWHSPSTDLQTRENLRVERAVNRDTGSGYSGDGVSILRKRWAAASGTLTLVSQWTHTQTCSP
jgi:hypothetical protein